MLAALDHDALFKLVLTAFFREFIDLVAPDLAAALDPAPPVFLDKESFADLLTPTGAKPTWWRKCACVSTPPRC